MASRDSNCSTPKSANAEARDPVAVSWIAPDIGPGHPECSDPECGAYPYYGVAPHECFYKRGAEFTIGQSIGLPPSQWPPNFVPDLEEGETAETVAYPNACGVYYCPTCVAEGRAAGRPAQQAPSLASAERLGEAPLIERDRSREEPQ